MFDFIINIMASALTFFYNLTASMGVANYGIAIILLTVAIKMAIYPLTAKSVRSMKAMQELQPKMKEIQEKFKGNPEKLNKELAALYKDKGVNPFSGCLPLLLQMPILIAIFFAIRDFQYAHQPSFLLWKDLGQPDPTYILPVLAAVTTYYQSKQTTTDTTSQQNKMMLYMMPLFIGYITTQFPAGLGLYWVVSNLVQIGQQWWMYRKPAEAAGEASK